MNDIFYTVCTLTLIGSAVSQASLVLIDDDFTGNSITSTSRFQSAGISSGNWNQRNGAGGSPTPGTWSISGGELTNTGVGDQGAHLLNELGVNTDTTLTQVTVSFDYNVGVGSTLYFHSALYTGPGSGATNISRTSRGGGEYFAEGSDFNSAFTSAHNLDGGATPTGATDQAVTSFTGGTSGTFSQTYDISGFTGIDSIVDVSHILAVFALDTAEAGNGAITIDNLNVTAVPEPSTFGLLGMSLAGLLLRRRRA